MGTRPEHLLIVGGGRDLPQRARDLCPGLRTSLLCRRTAVRRVRDAENHQRVIALRGDSPVHEWIAAARFVDSVAPVDLLTNYTERDLDKTAEIGRALGLPGHDPRTVQAVDDKLLMRSRLAAAGVDSTPAEIVSAAKDIRQFGDRLGYPLICKPARGVASKGIARVEKPEDAASALDWALAGAQDLDVSDVLVEPFHEGDVYTVECVSEDGKHVVACMTKTIWEPSHFVELGHVVPAPIDDASAARAHATVRAALDSLEITTGVTCTEVIVTPRDVRIVETHLRLPGDEIPAMLARATGIDLVEIVVKQSLGFKVLDELSAALKRGYPGNGFAAIWYACPAATGEVVSVAGVDAAKAEPGVCDVEIYIGAGGRLTGLASSLGRAAHVWAIGGSPAQALSRARKGSGSLRYVVATPGLPNAGMPALGFPLPDQSTPPTEEV